MKNRKLTFLLFLLGGTIFLFPGFNGDQWNMVREHDYRGWQTTSERVVVARLAKSQQDGLFSAGGLLGLLDSPDGWIFGKEIANRQYEVYETGAKIQSYLVYKSHPGFQGVIFGIVDRLTNFSAEKNLRLFRVMVAFGSATVIALIAATVAVEFGWLAGLLVLLFSVISEWMILPGGSLYWNLWAFYLPFVCGTYALTKAENVNQASGWKIFGIIFLTTLIKILFTGFELITTALVMATVPFVYFASRNRWGWKKLGWRVIQLGIVLSLATLAGLAILLLQIAANDGGFSSAIDYIRDTISRRALGNPENFRGVYAESMQASVFVVIGKYLNTPAFTISMTSLTYKVLYWHLMVVFIFFTLVFIIKYWRDRKLQWSDKGSALIVTTWFSIAAPLSWYIIFKPTSYIHTFLFPMAWQMPFVLLGFALCGYVIHDLFKLKTTRTT